MLDSTTWHSITVLLKRDHTKCGFEHFRKRSIEHAKTRTTLSVLRVSYIRTYNHYFLSYFEGSSSNLMDPCVQKRGGLNSDPF